MKQILMILPMIILMLIMIPFLSLGFIWHWIKFSFDGGMDKAERLEKYIDKIF